MKEKYITALKEVQNPTINSKYDLQTWQAQTVNLITRIYGENCKQEEQINKIEYIDYMPIGTMGGGNNSIHCEKQANEIITSYITDLETFGIPELKNMKENDGINISVNQNQSVNINIIWESIRNELTGKQIKEVEELINGNDKPDSKKKKIFNKLNSFGSNVASNIIASLLTNPAIYGG